MTDPAAQAARAAAIILAADLGPGLPAEVEAVLYAREHEPTRSGTFDFGLGIAAATLIVTIAQLAWSVCGDHRKEEPKPSLESVSRQVRISLREHDTVQPAGTERIAEVVISEVIKFTGESE